MKNGSNRAIYIAIVLAVIGVAAILVLNSVMSQPDVGYYTKRPTFYNLPVVVFSNSTHTEELREHISYSTFNYEITSNASRIASAPVDSPIIIDGYSLDNPGDWQVAEACSQALKNGSVIVTLWSHEYSFMNMVSGIAYGHDAIGYDSDEADIQWFGLWNGNNSAQASVSTYHAPIEESGTIMTVLTEAYEWSVRRAYDQPYHPTLYP